MRVGNGNEDVWGTRQLLSKGFAKLPVSIGSWKWSTQCELDQSANQFICRNCRVIASTHPQCPLKMPREETVICIGFEYGNASKV